MTSLFGSTDNEDDIEPVTRSPFVLTGLPPEVLDRIYANEFFINFFS